MSTRTNFSNAILNYGPTLPIGPVADGTLFHLTAGATGLYVYNFRQDVTIGTIGDQVGQGWQLLATTGSIDANTLDGLDSTAFQLRDADLTALAALPGTGFAVRTGPDTWDTRSLAAGLAISLSNTNGSIGDITIGVTESALSLNNISGTLSATKGGTGNTGPFSPGGLIYVGGTTGPLNSTSAGTAGQVLLSGGAGVPVWTNQSLLSVGTATNASFATTAGIATSATTAGSASTVPWTGVTGKPTTLAGFGITDSVTKTYVDTADYLNLPPLAGVLRDNIVPVYSDFKFSQGNWNTSTFTLVDREGKQVKYYNTSTPLGSNNMYRAYRYSDVDAWVFDNEPISVGFALVSEKVGHMSNCGTNFAVLRLLSTALPQTLSRVVIVSTNGSSDAADWILLADVTSLHSTLDRVNFGVVQTTSGARILAVYTNSGTAHSVYMNVYNTSLTLLRTLTLHDAATMVNTGDTLGQGRVAPAATSISLLNYSGLGNVYPFTWNPFNERFHLHCSSYYVWATAGGVQVGQGIGVSISWSIPKSWIESGSGTPTHLIPIKSGSFRYNMLPDSTWGTQTGGMSNTAIGGVNISLVTDEYSGQLIGTAKGSFNQFTTGDAFRLAAGFGYQTFDTNLLSPQILASHSLSIPDGSAWSKQLTTYWGQVIGDQILMRAVSTQYGDRYVQAQFSTSQFSSVAQTNDTLKLDSPSAVLSPHLLPSVPAAVLNGWAAGNFGVTVAAGVPTYYFNRPGQLVYTITASGTNRTYTSTGLTMPALPSTISGVTGIVGQELNAWNLSVGSPVFYSVVRSGTGQAYVAKYSGGSWSIPASNLFQAEIDAGKTSRGDTLNEIGFSEGGQALLTEGGRFMFGFVVRVTGGAQWHYGSYNVNTNVATSGGIIGGFAPVLTSPGYGNSGGYPGYTFGYSTTFGYYAYIATGNYDAAYFCSSRDVRNGSTITETQWATNSATRFQIYLTTESATGLVAYISSYPLFIGGYYCTTPTQSISLAASTVNYVYAAKNPSDRTTVDISTTTTLLPSSFSRALLAAITTNATNIVSSVSYPVAQEDAVEDLSNVSIAAKQVNDALTWNGSQWVNAPAVRVDETRSGSFAINGALVAGSRDLFTYGVSSVSSTLAPSQINLAGALTASGSVTASGGGGGLARAILQPGGSGLTGAIDFHSVIGREGYIGRSTSVSSADGGTIKYVSGSHEFTGNIVLPGGFTPSSITHSSINLRGTSVGGTLSITCAAGPSNETEFNTASSGSTYKFKLMGAERLSVSNTDTLVTGTFTATGDVVAYSDARVKTHIETIPNALETVQKLRGVNFNRISNGTPSTGVIAQEVLEVMPEVVHKQEDGMYGVAYGNMVGVLIEAIKEQQAQIEALRAEVQELKKA